MPSEDQNDAPETTAPTSDVLVPISADEFQTQHRRRRTTIFVTLAIIVAATVYSYFRLTAPGRALESYQSASQLFAMARYPQAVLALDRALNYKPDYPEAFMLRGKAHLADSKWKESIDDFTRVTELQPTNPFGFIERASAWIELKQFEKAAEDCKRAVALDPKQADAYRYNGIVLRELGDLDGAIVDLTRAVELDPQLQEYMERGITYHQAGQYEKAIEDFDAAHQKDPINPQPLYARSRSKRQIGDVKGADSDHQAARKIEGYY